MGVRREGWLGMATENGREDSFFEATGGLKSTFQLDKSRSKASSISKQGVEPGRATSSSETQMLHVLYGYTRILQSPSIQELLRQINVLRPQILGHILRQKIIRARAAHTAIQMVMQKEVHGVGIR